RDIGVGPEPLGVGAGDVPGIDLGLRVVAGQRGVDLGLGVVPIVVVMPDIGLPGKKVIDVIRRIIVSQDGVDGVGVVVPLEDRVDLFGVVVLGEEVIDLLAPVVAIVVVVGRAGHSSPSGPSSP